jgi:hypothetical protein
VCGTLTNETHPSGKTYKVQDYEDELLLEDPKKFRKKLRGLQENELTDHVHTGVEALRT